MNPAPSWHWLTNRSGFLAVFAVIVLVAASFHAAFAADNAPSVPAAVPPSSPAVVAPAAPVSPGTNAPVLKPGAASADPLALAAASNEATRWMAEITAGKYSQAWIDSAAVLQKAITQSDWVDGLTERKERFGRLLMQKQDTAEFTRTLPGAPLGEYFVIRFLSKYENTPALVETVVMAKDALGEWAVVGYDVESLEK